MSKFCRECGAPLHGRRFCSQCGVPAVASSSDIPTVVSATSYTAPPTHLAPPSPRTNKKRSGSVDVPDMATGDEATSIYKRVVATVRGTHFGEHADDTVKAFKKDCKQYGSGGISAEVFEANLRVYLGDFMMDTMMPQLVRLIPDDEKRAELLAVYRDNAKSKAPKSRPATIGSTSERQMSLASRPSWTPKPEDVDAPLAERSGNTGSIKSVFKKLSGPSIYGKHAICEMCTTKFDLRNRRHHCRKCGKAVCQSCSPAYMLIPEGFQHEGAKGYDVAVPQRVCTLCAPILQPLQARLEATFANCHQGGPPQSSPEALPTDRGWFKSLPVHQSLANECEAARDMLRQFFLTSPAEKRIPVAFLERAHGLAFLTVVKAGLLVTAKMGSGIVVARLGDNSWSAPSAIGTAGIGGGLEGGGEVVQVLLILSSAQAVSVFFQTQLTLGAGLDLAVGPYGRSALAQAAMGKGNGGLGVNYSYSHSRGFFAGISLHGAVIRCREDANRAFYGRHVTPSEILTGAVPPPRAAHGVYEAIGDAMLLCEEYRAEEAKPRVASCVTSGCPCEKFRARSYSTMCANCGHSHQL
ncbi:hypothetical protein H310_00197 [Aphanomyces invadans]|uniref:FYVE-type domain-containing protein n=1 Tax=Aphanomyces invadans TaxID=157072 RepID=A0A024UTJ8_9STRA|nr:hypothetical protein H310_00197 [Aphanomyces invadans]ETW09684.1 hypothetical protein H310_00197 [Aphanomyces invadans]|eukprot:XP_008861095.1 hypothetical protein H310_00197 [Aphanomyces invadans]